MAHPMGESKPGGLRVDFDRRLGPEFHGSRVTGYGQLSWVVVAKCTASAP